MFRSKFSLLRKWSIDRREFAVGIFLDLSKAFDTVNHNILLDKLNYYGIRGLSLDWFKSYLSNRFQYVEFNGSILGPLLFLLYINDLNQVSNILEFILFADDTYYFLENIVVLFQIF